MAGLFKGQSKVIPEFTGLQVNTAVQVLPIPIIWGSPRVDINLIYYNGFYSTTSKSSGKGILSGGKGSSSVKYYATIFLAIGEGPIPEALIIYQNSEVWTPSTFPTPHGAAWVQGTSTQLPFPFVASLWPTDARAYRDTCYMAVPEAELDSSATVPQLNMCVRGLLAATSPLYPTTITISTGQYDSSGNAISFIGNIPLGDADADPAQVIWDFLTNDRYGAGFPVELIDATTLFSHPEGFVLGIGDTTVSTFCQAVGLAWSVVLNNSESAGSILDRWCRNLTVAIVWNGAKLKFIPYYESPVITNPGWDPVNVYHIPKKYYTPYLYAICIITMDQILQSTAKEEDPIVFTRKDPWEVYNTMRIDFKDRMNFFNSNVAESKDEALIELYGPRVDNLGQAGEFSYQPYAAMSAQLQLRRAAKIRRTYTWKMGPLWGWLEPMHIVDIPNPVDYTQSIVVRIISIEEDADENITIEAEEYPAGEAQLTLINLSPTTPPNQGATNVPPAPVYPPVMFAPTTDMLTATGFAVPQWIFGASAGRGGTLDTMWGGCDIWISLDNASYEQIGTLFGPSIIGSVNEPLAAGGSVLYVNLNESNGTLTSVSSTAAQSGASICCLQDVSGFEILSYTTATLVGPYTYALTGLYRGLYGTTPRLWGAGSEFLFCGTNANMFEVHLPDAYVGQDFYVKAQSFNSFNTAVEDITEVVAYRYRATSPTPAPPGVPPMKAPALFRPVAAAMVPRR